jgi:hypothetical protein
MSGEEGSINPRGDNLSCIAESLERVHERRNQELGLLVSIAVFSSCGSHGEAVRVLCDRVRFPELRFSTVGVSVPEKLSMPCATWNRKCLSSPLCLFQTGLATLTRNLDLVGTSSTGPVEQHADSMASGGPCIITVSPSLCVSVALSTKKDDMSPRENNRF